MKQQQTRALLVCICLVMSLLFATRAFAAEVGLAATIRTEKAQIYEQPDFDAKVIGSLRGGSRVRVSKGVAGRYHKFHKVRVGKRSGFISDVDVNVGGDPRAPASEKGRKGASRGSRKPKKTMPVYFSRFVGILVGQVGFKEDIAGVNASENLLIYGLKVTGPDVIVSGPSIDFNLALHYGAPTYYEKLSAVRPAGFVLFTDALALLPVIQRQNAALLFGIGPMLSYSSFQVVNAGRAQSLSMLNLGLSSMLGGVVRFAGVGLRLEAKYIYEKQSYTVYQAAVQTEW